MQQQKFHTTTLGLARSLLALCMLLTLLCNSIYDLFPGYHFADNQRLAHGIERINLFYLFSYKHILIPYLFSIAVLVAVISGYFPRITALLHAWVAYSIYYSLLIIEGGDQITAILTLLLLPACLTDNRRNHWQRRNQHIISNDVLRFFVRTSLIFLRAQMALLYLDAGVEKLKVNEWADGTAVYYWFNHNIFGAPGWMRWLLGGAFSNPYFVTAVTLGVIVLEISLFTGLFVRQRQRYLLFAFAFPFHFLIFLTHGLATFWMGMTGGLILYLWRMDRDAGVNLKSLSGLFAVKNISHAWYKFAFYRKDKAF